MKLPPSSGKPKKPRFLVVRRVSGDSMLPALKPRRIVIVRPYFNLKVGEVVVVRHDGLEKIKRIAMAKDGHVFVLGDNPDCSTDSRTFGWLSYDAVVGKLLWPQRHRS